MEFIKKMFNKTMTFIIILTIFFLFVILSTSVCAHSPSNMNLNYDKSTSELKVEITHQVSNPSTHYVYNIEININDELYISKNYTSQPGSSFEYTYEDIGVIEEETIQVTALCIQGGSITKELIINAEDVTDTSDDLSTPGFGLLIILFAFVIFFYTKKIS
jgi:hypothetical protein